MRMHVTGTAVGLTLSVFVFFQKRVFGALGLIAGEGVQRHGVDTAEDGFFDVGVVPFQPTQQDLDLLPLGAASAIVSDGAAFCEAAGALDELQLVILPPRDDIVLMDAVHGANELHAFKVVAVELGQHGL